MNGIKLMNETISSLLLEAQLKDVFNLIKVDDIFSVDLKDGRMFTYNVIENKAGDIKLRDRIPNETGLYPIFMISKDSMNDTIMTTWKYDSNQADGKGQELKFEIKRIRTGKDTGTIETIDVESPELTDVYIGFNKIINSAEVGDVLTISTVGDSQNGEEEPYNTVFLKVHNKKRNTYMVSLEDVEGNSDVLNNYFVNFNNRNFYINTNNLVRIKNNDMLSLTLAFKGRNNDVKKIFIDNIVEVQLNKESEDVNNPDNDDNKKMSKRDLQKLLDSDPTYQKMINQQPGILDVLRGASPRGVYQLAKKLKQSKVDNSFLTRGKYVKFKWDSPKIYKDEKNVLSRNASYEGKVEREGVIKLGNRNTGFFNLTLLDEIEPSVYKVKVIFINSKRNSNRENDGIIRILDNDSR